MKKLLGKKGVKYILFAAGGAVAGLIYYYAVGCSSGTCPITSSLGGTMLYGGLLGLWISYATSGGCCCSGGACSVEPKGQDGPACDC